MIASLQYSSSADLQDARTVYRGTYLIREGLLSLIDTASSGPLGRIHFLINDFLCLPNIHYIFDF